MSVPDRSLPFPQFPMLPVDIAASVGSAPGVTTALHLLRFAAENARMGHHHRAFDEVRGAVYLSEAPLVRAYAAVLLATWHKQGAVRFEPVATRSMTPAAEAHAWSEQILKAIQAGRGTRCNDAELMALSVQLLLHVWSARALAFLTQRIVLLVCAGDFQHDETAGVLRDLVAPQLVRLGLTTEADLALMHAHDLLARLSPSATPAPPAYLGN